MWSLSPTPPSPENYGGAGCRGRCILSACRPRPNAWWARPNGKWKNCCGKGTESSPALMMIFTVRTLDEFAQMADKTMGIMTILLTSVAAVSLMVGGIGIMNIMLVSVTERTREIGIRMAVGARKRDVLIQFMAEAVTMSVVGGIFGTLLGIAASRLIGMATGWMIPINVDVILLATLFSAAVGIFFGFYPARKASAMDPIEALRYE